jgi:hypothetical protein
MVIRCYPMVQAVLVLVHIDSLAGTALREVVTVLYYDLGHDMSSRRWVMAAPLSMCAKVCDLHFSSTEV